MKKIILVIVIVLLLGGFVVFKNLGESSETTEENNMMGAAMPSASSMPMMNYNYKDGTYTGSVGSASQYGDIQVKVIITGGKITDIQYLQFPDGGGHTAEVTAMAKPALKQEAITAQSAKINTVSGATQDTEGFIQSLQSALDQAKS
ncbi:hypothetical protein BH10PAT1_BH10PAT1_2740 [soil metagenome]